MFSTEDVMHGSTGDMLEYTTSDKWINATVDGAKKTLESKSYRFDSLNYHPDDLCKKLNLSDGGLEATTGSETQTDGTKRSSFIRAYPSVTYSIQNVVNPVTICFYNEKNIFIQG